MTPPNMAHIGERYPAAVLAKTVRTPSGSTSSILVAGDAASLISLAQATTAAASESLPGVGSLPFFMANASSALKPTWRTALRSSLAKSDSRNSPGSSIAAARVLKASFLVSFTCVAIPPPVYWPYAVVSSSSSNE